MLVNMLIIALLLVKKVSLTGNPVNGNHGLLDGTAGGYSMGGASDGKYLYLAVNTNGNRGTTLFKVDPISYEVIAKSTQFTVGDIDGDNSRLFIKDGILYCIDIKIKYSQLN